MIIPHYWILLQWYVFIGQFPVGAVILLVALLVLAVVMVCKNIMLSFVWSMTMLFALVNLMSNQYIFIIFFCIKIFDLLILTIRRVATDQERSMMNITWWPNKNLENDKTPVFNVWVLKNKTQSMKECWHSTNNVS